MSEFRRAEIFMVAVVGLIAFGLLFVGLSRDRTGTADIVDADGGTTTAQVVQVTEAPGTSSSSTMTSSTSAPTTTSTIAPTTTTTVATTIATTTTSGTVARATNVNVRRRRRLMPLQKHL